MKEYRHPETGIYINTAKLRRRIKEGGLESSLRKSVWPHLLGVSQWDKPPDANLQERKKEYLSLKAMWEGANNLDDCEVAAVKQYHRVIENDVDRTDRKGPLFHDRQGPLEALRAVLLTFCCYKLGETIGYFQGMNDTVAIFCHVFDSAEEEAEIFWCFVAHIERRSQVYLQFPEGLHAEMKGIDRLLDSVDTELNDALRAANDGSTQYPFLFQSVFLLLKREMSSYEACARVWEACYASDNGLWDLIVVVAMIRMNRNKLLENGALELTDAVQAFNAFVGTLDAIQLLRMAQRTMTRLEAAHHGREAIGDVLNLMTGNWR